MVERDVPNGSRAQVRTVVAAGMPLLVVSIDGDGAEVFVGAVRDAGLGPLEGLIGSELERGARMGIVVDAQLRVVDEQDTTLLRAPRDGVDGDWLTEAQRLRGTIFVVVRELDLEPEQTSSQLVTVVDEWARTGRAWGAIVGVVVERPNLPLLLS